MELSSIRLLAVIPGRGRSDRHALCARRMSAVDGRRHNRRDVLDHWRNLPGYVRTRVIGAPFQDTVIQTEYRASSLWNNYWPHNHTSVRENSSYRNLSGSDLQPSRYDGILRA